MKKSDLSRRQFLAHSAGFAGASLGLGVYPRRLAAGAEVRLAIVGVGDRGTQLLGAALKIPGVKVVGIADVDPAHRKRAGELARQQKPRLVSDPLLLLEEKDLDAVIIASPVFLHRQHAVAALQSGKHVYLEKPMASNVEDLRTVFQVAQEAEERGQIFQIGLQRRYNPRYIASMSLIEKGEAGRVLFVRAQWHSTGDPARGSKPWYFHREKSGDIVVEQACHQMDVFNWVFGSEPLQACGLGGSNQSPEAIPGRDIRDHYGLVMEYPCGGKVHYSHLSYSIPDRRFSGVYELVYGEKLGLDLQNAIAWDRSGKTVQLFRQGGNDTQIALSSFFRSIHQGGRPAADSLVGYNATLTSLMARDALDTGRTVRWSEVCG